MTNKLPAFLQINEEHTRPIGSGKKQGMPFVDRTLRRLGKFIKSGYIQAETVSRKGFLQKLDARTKLVFLLSFVFLASFLHSVTPLFFVLIFILALYPLSGLNLLSSLRKAFLPLFLFGFLAIAPAMLNIVSGGEIKFLLFRFQTVHSFWIYHIPVAIGISDTGILLFIKLLLKIGISILITFLVFNTTSFAATIKAMRMFKAPDIVLLSITLSYKFIFILSQTTQETYLALRSRWVKHNTDLESSKIIAGRIGYVFQKSWMKYEEIFRAMIARGFSGKVTLCYPGNFHLNDLLFLIFFICFGIICSII